VRRRSEGDTDEARAFGGDAGAAGVGLREIAGGGDLTDSGGSCSVACDG
jgi:hypothetical protein